LAARAQVSGDLADAVVVEQADDRIPERGHHHWSLARMNQARILAERDVLAPVEPVFDEPVAPLQLQELGWCAPLR
jgi:hypothetical protein